MGNQKRRYDVLIVGAGIIGLSTAYHIKKDNPDLSVLVVDRNVATAQAETAKSLAALRDCFTSDVNRLLARSTIEFYKHVQNDLGFNLNMELIGYLWLMTESGLKNFEPIQEELSGHGVKLRVWDRRELGDMIPDLVLDPGSEQSRIIGLESISRGIQGLNCGTVSPDLVASFYEKEFRRLGGEFQLKTEVNALHLAPKKPLHIPGEPHIWQETVFDGIETNGEMLAADTIVMAAGVRTPFLLDPAGIDCLVKPKKRQVFRVSGEALDRLLTTKGYNDHNTIPLTILPKGGVHFRPAGREKSVWVIAADHLGRPFRLEEDPSPEESYYTYNIQPILTEYFPCFRDLRPISAWAGLYDINSIDGTPIVERFSNCVVVTGMSGSGIMKADGIGRVAAALIEGKDDASLFDGSKLSVSRLGIRGRAVEREKLVL